MILIIRSRQAAILLFAIFFLLITVIIVTNKASDNAVISSGVAENTLKAFVEKFNWHTEGNIFAQKVSIPSTFIDESGDFPIGLFWAFNNELSKEIGLDISPYKGKEVDAYIVFLKENFLGPNKLRAEVIGYNGRIIGAWLAKDGYGFCSALNKKRFEEITNKAWGDWLVDEGFVDYDKGFDADTRHLLPDEVIKMYYDAINKKDYKTAYALLSKAQQTLYLFRNNYERKLYNYSWDPHSLELSNILSANLKNCQPTQNYRYDPNQNPPYNILNRNVSHKISYIVHVDMKYKQTITSDSGLQRRTITLVKETPNSPWRIDAENTG